MTCDRLYDLLRLLGNQCWLRYYLYWDYPQPANRIVICPINITNDLKVIRCEILDLEKECGFQEKQIIDGLVYYFFERD